MARAFRARLICASAFLALAGGGSACAENLADAIALAYQTNPTIAAERAKSEMLGVPTALIEQYGAVSEEVARAMAQGALKHSGAQLAVSVTGIAGPTGGTPAKPIGLVHFAAAREGQTTLHLECRFGDIGRSEIRMRSVEAALKLLLQII